MSSSISPNLYPIVIIQDRYHGIYSNGRWFAVASAQAEISGMPRATWVLEHGPGAGDTEAADFWESVAKLGSRGRDT